MNFKGTNSYTTQKYSYRYLEMNFVPFYEYNPLFVVDNLVAKQSEKYVTILNCKYVYDDSIVIMFDFRLFVGYLYLSITNKHVSIIKKYVSITNNYVSIIKKYLSINRTYLSIIDILKSKNRKKHIKI